MRTQDDSEQSLSVMEYFILALVGKARLTSLYAFQQRAGLQPGGIRTSLQRLEDRGLLERAKSGSRQRRDLSLTPAGARFLEKTWKHCVADYPDAESILRAATIAVLMGDEHYAAEYLSGVALTRESSGREKNMEAERLRSGQLDPLSIYAWMRALTEAQRREAESHAFSKFGRTLKERHQPDVVNTRE